MRMLFDIPETGQELRVGRTTVYELIKTGELRPIRIGKRTLIPREELERFIAERQQVGGDAA